MTHTTSAGPFGGAVRGFDTARRVMAHLLQSTAQISSPGDAVNVPGPGPSAKEMTVMEDTLSRLYGAADPVQTAMLDDVAMRAGVMPESGCRRVPLWDKKGDVAAWATVDAEDYETVMAYRWHRASRGYGFHGYRVPGGGTRHILMHRLVLGLEYGDPRQADHINRDKLDNRRSNLRICNQAENNQNVVGGRGRSGVHGVHWHSPSGRWMARVRLDGKLYWLGWHDTVEAAGEVVREWRKQNVPFSQEAMQ